MREAVQKILQVTRKEFITPYAIYVSALAKHVHTSPRFSLFQLDAQKLNRLPNRRFFVEGVAACHRHCKHMISPIEYISLLIMGAPRCLISR